MTHTTCLCARCDHPSDALAVAALMRQRERFRGRVHALRTDRCRPRGEDRRRAIAELREWNAECVARATVERAFAGYLAYGSDR